LEEKRGIRRKKRRNTIEDIEGGALLAEADAFGAEVTRASGPQIAICKI